MCPLCLCTALVLWGRYLEDMKSMLHSQSTWLHLSCTHTLLTYHFLLFHHSCLNIIFIICRLFALGFFVWLVFVFWFLWLAVVGGNRLWPKQGHNYPQLSCCVLNSAEQHVQMSCKRWVNTTQCKLSCAGFSFCKSYDQHIYWVLVLILTNVRVAHWFYTCMYMHAYVCVFVYR